jgi:membrane fusion protein, multidrug efflux system
MTCAVKFFPRKVAGVAMIELAICGCSSKAEKPAPPPPGVTIAPVTQKDVPIRQEWVGTMVGNTDADIRPKVEGFLLTRLYSEGSFVKKGQPMFQLDKRQAQASLEQATGNLERTQAALSQAQIDVRRYTPLVAQRQSARRNWTKRKAPSVPLRFRQAVWCDRQKVDGSSPSRRFSLLPAPDLYRPVPRELRNHQHQ